LLRVEVMSASQLIDKDGIGKSDPYAIISFDEDEMGQPRHQQTHVIEDNLFPVWNHVMYFLISDECKSFHVQVKDEDIGRDAKLGHCTVLRRDSERRAQRHEDEYYLEDGGGATIRLAIQEVDLCEGIENNMNEHKGHMEEAIRGPAQQNLLLQVRIHSAEKLKSSMLDKSDPYAKFKFESDLVFPRHGRTPTIDNNPDPVWECLFHFIVPRGLDHFQVEIMDEDSISDDSLGHANLVMGRLGERKSDKYAITKKGQLRASYVLVPMNGLF